MKYDLDRYYIFDCNGKLVGNPFGYKTHGSATGQAERKGATIRSQIWHAFHKARQANMDHKLVYMIKAGGAV
jgi:hypothetical protein